MKKIKWIIGIVLFLAVNIWLTSIMEVDIAEGIGEAPHKLEYLFGIKLPMNGINIATVLNTWLIMAVLIIFAIISTRKLVPVPGRAQTFAEMLVSGFDSLCCDVLGERRGRQYLPFIATLFVFVLLSNWIGVIPSFWHLFKGVVPSWLVLEEPTKDLNTPLCLGLLAFLVAHLSGIWVRGIKHYLIEYCQPMITIAGKNFPNLPMGVLNVVGEFGKTVSHSFRLFGNIFGGSIVVLVLSRLSIEFVRLMIGLPIGIPIGPLVFLNGFLGLFVGMVQAFVFAMLALVYISLWVNE
jgi:F-type H+-transporting ATPase subunit a